jgi:hypothetical protein
MIDQIKMPVENLDNFFDIEEFTTSIAQKLNEVISFINDQTEDSPSFEEGLYKLIESWKQEADLLSNNPEEFPGFSPEVCAAIAKNKIHCCSEIITLIKEYQP